MKPIEWIETHFNAVMIGLVLASVVILTLYDVVRPMFKRMSRGARTDTTAMEQDLNRVRGTAQRIHWLLLATAALAVTIGIRVDQVYKNIESWASNQGFARVQVYRGKTDFFSAMNEVLTTTQNEVRLTAVRDDPPWSFITRSDESVKWYDNIKQWAKQDPDRHAVRIFAAETPEMQTWGRQLCKELDDSGITNFDHRVVPWPKDFRLPFINMCIFDQRTVFLIFSPLDKSLAESKFIRIDSPELASFLITGYYLSLESRGENLKTKVEAWGTSAN